MHQHGLLRFSTAGSVDDGKSTLIGRLLYDAKSIFEDQLSNLVRTTARRGGVGGNAQSELAVDLALLTDGLIAEREQGITIDVAYRYFATPERKFIIADTPGHEQYTRNMVTGASTADLTIVLVDASKGILAQSRRHALIASLLGIRHVVVAINKMDLVAWSQERYLKLVQDFESVAERLGLASMSYVPLSALHGDMVVSRGSHLDWYDGPTLLQILETAEVGTQAQAALRFPVQLVSRPGVPGSYTRGYMGRIEAGRVAVGDTVLVQPGGQSARVAAIVTHDGSLKEAAAPQSITLLLDRELDISRGDLICHPQAPAQPSRSFDAMLCWMDTDALDTTRRYVIQHTTRSTKGRVDAIAYRLNIGTLDREAAPPTLAMNDIARVTVKTRHALLIDPYEGHRATGGFIVIDELSNRTVAAGMVLAASEDAHVHG